ncbi:restriction endonuclease subunit S [Psychrosphaera aquimarina]|uniref:Restriction endonuclease subunit S n=1 Tax=Psychrosphaera aquimarina TaxID=2044854 RepID=A0ABU3QXX2_9GAMM|nr:restriction endonuclease subunit S [Psychrosphaera aquimarina]MDU0112291.1 restriction endonuclease subunit S [Psychrosphaera aquimarina]
MKLKEVTKIRAGHPFRGRIDAKDDAESKVIQIKDIDNDGVINWNNLVRTNVETQRGSTGWLTSGNIIIASRGPRNIASCITLEPEVPTVCSPHFFIITITNPKIIMPEFLAWQLNQAIAKRYFELSAEGSLQVGIRKSVIEEFDISVPDIEIQKNIVELAKTSLKEKNVMLQLIHNRELQLKAIANSILKK